MQMISMGAGMNFDRDKAEAYGLRCYNAVYAREISLEARRHQQELNLRERQHKRLLGYYPDDPEYVERMNRVADKMLAEAANNRKRE